MRERRGAYNVLLGKTEGKSPLEEAGVDGSIILKWIIKQWNRWYGLDYSGSGYGQVACFCKCGNEPSNSIKFGGFFD
jgi:hypothetical protein